MKQLTDKQKRFCDEYLIDSNATQVAIRAGYRLVPCRYLESSYVYMLVDSHNSEIFYVGKGKGWRYSHHEKEWKNNKTVNPRKIKRIGDILLNGGRVLAFFFVADLSSDMALCIEKKLISTIGRERLTNASRGCLPKAERNALSAQTYLAKIKPFYLWGSEKQRTPIQIFMYHWVVKNFNILASSGSKILSHADA